MAEWAQQQKCIEPERFSVENEEWLPYLKENGYVVLKGVASEAVLEETLDGFWKDMENLGNIKRDDVSTWGDENWPGWLHTGFLLSHGLPHSKTCWNLRSLPSVKQAFAKIWDTENLVVSMDLMIGWRPWWVKGVNIEKPRVERIHVDQNPVSKKGFRCVQGMLVLRDVTLETGGLQVVPRTNTDEVQAELAERYPNPMHDFVQLRLKDPYILNNAGRLLLAKAGDFILWDSRTIHGGFVGTGSKSRTDEPRLARLAQTICMVPAKTCKKKTRKHRWNMFNKGRATTHWPSGMGKHAAYDTGGKNITAPEYKPIELTPEQRLLIGKV